MDIKGILGQFLLNKVERSLYTINRDEKPGKDVCYDPSKEGKGTVVHTRTATHKTTLKRSERGK